MIDILTLDDREFRSSAPGDLLTRINWQLPIYSPEMPVNSVLPHIQLQHAEIAEDDVERVLNYANITRSSSAFGVPDKIDPIIYGGMSEQVCVFPIEGLEKHIAKNAADVYDAYLLAGSMDALVDKFEDELTARQYLIGGLLEAIRCCNRFRRVLRISW